MIHSYDEKVISSTKLFTSFGFVKLSKEYIRIFQEISAISTLMNVTTISNCLNRNLGFIQDSDI